jgi:hypothetical protein
MDEVTTADGATVYVARDELERGSEAPFAVVYTSPDRERRYGYACGNCESLDTAMDTMGRIVCGRCGNHKRPDEWDAAHE